MRRSLVHLGFLLLACACGGSSTTTTTDAGTGSDTGAVPGDGATSDAGGTVGLPGDEYCRSAPNPGCRGTTVNTCGVCVTPSPRRDVLERTNCDDTQRREYCRPGTPGAPNLQCFQPGSYPTAGTSERVTMFGHVRVFGNGGDSQHIKISVHRVNEDGTPGEMLGSTVSDIASPAAGMEVVYSPSRDRPLFTRRTGGYTLSNIPTETELLVITEGDPADAEASGLWSHRIYDYNFVLLNSEIDAMPAPTGVVGRSVRFNPRVISNSDWTAIPATSTLTSGITRGRGALAGEVHDCDDVRLANATVESTPRRAWDGPVVYFSENDTNPLPDLSREQRGTSLLGTYALLDVEPGPVRVAAVGYNAARAVVHLGSYRARIFPDSVTLVTFRGMRPWQAPAR
ncbi:MAG: hypothetical protein KA978_03210 [Deltaproteobacteria bacterium]|jgi:hypothetical protein|nr:hypothetical protein [Deltaproteobacteria bacterium]